MEHKQNKRSAWILALLLMLGAFTFAFQLGAVRALAQDYDSDGFSDTLETNGFTLASGMSLAVYPNITGTTPIPNCTKAGKNFPRDECVDPNTKDLFVIIQRGTNPCSNPTRCGDPCGPFLFPNANPATDIAPPSPTNYVNTYGTTFGPLQWVSGIATGFTTHELVQNPPSTSQLVTQAQGGWYAVKIVEDLNPCSSWMGLSTPGTITPTAPGSATVWPEKIMNWIDKACSQACFKDSKGNTTCYYVPVPGVSVPAGYVAAPGNFTCTNANHAGFTPINMKAAPSLTPLYHDFIKNVVSHETSHMMHLAFGSGTSADNHWPGASSSLMEQFIGTKATKDKNGNIAVTLYISTAYAPADTTQPGGYSLK